MKNSLFALLFIGAIVLGGVWYVAREKENDTTGASAKTFTLVVKERRLVSGDGNLQVKQGDLVTINVTADEEEEFHLHGYDKSVDLFPGAEASLVFEASASGRYPFELEKSKTELGAISIEP